MYSLELNEQFKLLSKYKIFPLQYRKFYHMCSFIFSIFFTNNKLNHNLKRKIKRNEHTSRRSFAYPSFKTTTNKYSFATISTKILNNLKTRKLDSCRSFSSLEKQNFQRQSFECILCAFR